MNPTKMFAYQSLTLLRQSLSTAVSATGRMRSLSSSSLEMPQTVVKVKRLSQSLIISPTASPHSSPESSPIPTRRRSYSSIQTGTTEGTLNNYFQEGKNLNNYFEAMAKIYLDHMPQEKREAIIQQFGGLPTLLADSNLIKAEFADFCLTELVKLDKAKISPEIDSRWLEYTISECESLPGFTNRYSTGEANAAFNFNSNFNTKNIISVYIDF